MGILTAMRELVWPASMPVAPVTPPKALSDVTTPPARDIIINAPWQNLDGALSLVGGYTASYAAMYRCQPWVHVAVNKLSRGIGRLPLKVYRRDGEERARDRDSSLAQLLARPYPGGSPFALKSQIVGDLAVYGNAILIKQGARRGLAPTALYPVSPCHWTLNEDGAYVWRDPNSGQEKVYTPAQLVHFRYWRPDDHGLGLAPLEPLRMTLAIEDAAQRLGVAAFKNGARPSGVLRTDQDISRDVLKELREDLKRLHGGPDNAMRPAILTNNLQWQAMSWDMQQAAVVEFRKLTREEVAAVYDIPPVLIGLLDRATFSNVEELHLAFYQDTLGPWTTLIEETLYEQLILPVAEWAELYTEFDMNEVLKGAVAQRFDAYNKAVGGPWMFANEARQRENLPPSDQDDANLIHFPLNMSTDPASAQAARQTAPIGGSSNGGA